MFNEQAARLAAINAYYVEIHKMPFDAQTEHMSLFRLLEPIVVETCVAVARAGVFPV